MGYNQSKQELDETNVVINAAVAHQQIRLDQYGYVMIALMICGALIFAYILRHRCATKARSWLRKELSVANTRPLPMVQVASAHQPAPSTAGYV